MHERATSSKDGTRRIGIGWTVGSDWSGGSDALNLALQLTLRGRAPRLLEVSGQLELDPLRRRLLGPALREHAAFPQPDQAAHFPVLRRLSAQHGFDGPAPGPCDIGLVSIPIASLTPAALQRAAAWPLLIAGSHWTARQLRALGLRKVVYAPAGVDLSMFHAAPRAGLFKGRYAIFSGGPLSFEKGQDIVVAAFRTFRQRHPEALLVCAWAGADAQQLASLSMSPHGSGWNGDGYGPAQLAAWLRAHDIPGEAVLDLGEVQQRHMPGILRECDLALFPSRCDGSANPAALEAMACALPTILSANTGHLDLLGEHLYILKQQDEVQRGPELAPAVDWGESRVDELLETMELAYRNPAAAREKGRAAAHWCKAWSWDRQAARLLRAVDAHMDGLPTAAPSPDECYAWGLGLHRAGRLAEAQQIYDTVLRMAPGHIAARGDRGNVRREQGDLAAAEADFRAVLAIRPDFRMALHSLGRLLRRDGRLEEAAQLLKAAVAGAPYPSGHWDLAFTLLQMGRYAEAWPHFDYRHEVLGLRRPDSSKPRWDGQPLVNGTLLVLDEQGLGDTLQFLRFLALIPRGDGGRVIFAGKPATLSTVRRILPAGDVFSWDQALPRATSWIPLMSLPARLGIGRPEQVPPPLPAPIVEAERVARWRDAVRAGDTRPVVGLCWRGNPDFRDDAVRSPGLAPLLPLLDLPGLRFVSLQVGPGREEIGKLGLTDRLHDAGGAVEAAGADVLDTLAVLTQCDFVISSCTSVAHMAGLLGRPGLILLSSQPDWRWMLERRDTPWYPSLQLLRQAAPGDWASVARQAASELAAWQAEMP